MPGTALEQYFVSFTLKRQKLLKAKGIRLFFSNEDKGIGLSDFFEQKGESPFFSTLERGVEWLEEDLIAIYGKRQNKDIRYELNDFEICRSLNADEIEYLDRILECRQYQRGEYIVKAGDIADCMFFLTLGTVDVTLLMNGKNRRLASFGSGNIFGEMAIVERSVRSADIIVATDVVECLVLKLVDYEALMGKMPNLQMILLKNIVIQLSEKLRNANKQIQMLR